MDKRAAGRGEHGALCGPGCRVAQRAGTTGQWSSSDTDDVMSSRSIVRRAELSRAAIPGSVIRPRCSAHGNASHVDVE